MYIPAPVAPLRSRTIFPGARQYPKNLYFLDHRVTSLAELGRTERLAYISPITRVGEPYPVFRVLQRKIAVHLVDLHTVVRSNTIDWRTPGTGGELQSPMCAPRTGPIKLSQWRNSCWISPPEFSILLLVTESRSLQHILSRSACPKPAGHDIATPRFAGCQLG